MPTGFVLINCDNSEISSVIEQLKKIDIVKEIQGVFGMYDIVAKVEVDEKKIFTTTISTHIRNIDKLKSTLTLMVINPDGDFF